MSEQAEIPQLASELFEMSKKYLDQEAVQPLKRSGRYAGFSVAAGALFAVGWLLMSIAGLRYITERLPDTELYSVLAYTLAALAAVALAALLMWRATKTKGIR